MTGTILYHLSESNLDGKVLYPRIPNNFMTANGYEDNTIKRISFSKSINGALVGISSNLTGKIFYVHIPDSKYSVKSIDVTNDMVPDASLTEEVWVISKVKLQCIGKVKVTKSHSKAKKYKLGEMWVDTYEWDYHDV